MIGVVLALFFVSAPPTLAQAPTVQAESVQPPNPQAGRQIYAQNCAPCHGQTGTGDGPSAASLSVAPIAFANYDAIAGLPLTEWFNITKNGWMDHMMPPWGQRLNDQQIWDTVGYAWTLHTSSSQVEMGKAVYQNNCASCHGADGKGTKQGMPDFTNFAATSKVSQSEWARVVKEGRDGMPAFGDKISDAEQRAALEYTRGLSVGNMFGGLLQPGTGVISGTVTNETTGVPLTNQSVELGIFDGATVLDQRSTTTDSTGLYRFEKLPTDSNLVYVTRVEYAGVPYSSDIVSFQVGQDEANVPVSVYETTTDASAVRADRVHYIIEFQDGQALIAELMVFSNDGNRAYIGGDEGVLSFSLPPGAQALGISDGELGARYRQTEDGFVDTLPLLPGQGVRQILYRYALSYTGNKLDLVRKLAYPAANVNALVSDLGQKVTSQELSNLGVRQTQNGNYINLLGQNLPANQPITMHMTNLPSAGGTIAGTASGAFTANRVLLYALVGLAAAGAILLAAWPLLRQRTQARAATEASSPITGIFDDRERLIDALARLDIAYNTGEISETEYRDQRLRLKAQLLDVMRKEQG